MWLINLWAAFFSLSFLCSSVHLSMVVRKVLWWIRFQGLYFWNPFIPFLITPERREVWCPQPCFEILSAFQDMGILFSPFPTAVILLFSSWVFSAYDFLLTRPENAVVAVSCVCKLKQQTNLWGLMTGIPWLSRKQITRPGHNLEIQKCWKENVGKSL